MTKGLTYDLIKKASGGDVVSIEKILSLYDPYINTISTVEMFDEEGGQYIGIDIDLKDRLRSKLIDIILKFKVS